jgi:hypothetical protein
MLAWLIDKVRWLLLIAAVGGPALAYFSWSDAERIRDVETNGVEAVALIEGATRTQRRRGGTSYALDLAWKDGKGGVRKAEKVSVSRTFADQIIRNDKLTRNSLRIKYLRDDETITPVVIEDASRQEDQDAFMLQAGLGAGAVGIAGSAVMLLMRRRRQTAEA